MKFDNVAEIRALKSDVLAAEYDVRIKMSAGRLNVTGKVKGSAGVLFYIAAGAAAMILDNHAKTMANDAAGRDALVRELLKLVETHLETLAREAEEVDADDQS